MAHMPETVICVENISKTYRLGVIGYGLLSRDLQSWWSRIRKTEDPNTPVESPGNSPAVTGTVTALKNVSFQVKRGEVLGMIGKNGAGKSTLLKIISRVTPPSSGEVRIRGRVGSLLEVGTGFHPELTGRENIYMNGAILGMKKQEIDRRFDDIVAFSEIEKFLDTPVKRYSSGMYVRLAFSVAAHLETDILLVDEVLAVGDASFQRRCLGKMGEVAHGGRTVVLVSHNMNAILSLCNRAIWLRDGVLACDGCPQAVVTEYLQTTFSARKRQEWDGHEGPGNSDVRLQSVTLVAPDDVITMETPLSIQVDFVNRTPSEHLDVTLHVLNEQDVVAFTTSSASNRAWRGQPMKTGVYRATCRVPGNLLNAGGYKVRLLMVKQESSVLFSLDDALSFEVLEIGRRPGWLGKRPGVLRPLLQWTVDPLP
jgi:lipopolysaccharide transport system ATP-binding protein